MRSLSKSQGSPHPLFPSPWSILHYGASSPPRKGPPRHVHLVITAYYTMVFTNIRLHNYWSCKIWVVCSTTVESKGRRKHIGYLLKVEPTIWSNNAGSLAPARRKDPPPPIVSPTTGKTILLKGKIDLIPPQRGLDQRTSILQRRTCHRQRKEKTPHPLKEIQYKLESQIENIETTIQTLA